MGQGAEDLDQRWAWGGRLPPTEPRPTVAPQQCGVQFPPTNLHATDAPAALRFYANRFATGETKRWDLAAHLLEQAAEIIEASRAAD